MLDRVRACAVSAGFFALALAWFVGSVVIATEVLGVEANRGNRWIVMVIYFAGGAALVAVLSVVEAVMHRTKHGPRTPGRRKRTPGEAPAWPRLRRKENG